MEFTLMQLARVELEIGSAMRVESLLTLKDMARQEIWRLERIG